MYDAMNLLEQYTATSKLVVLLDVIPNSRLYPMELRNIYLIGGSTKLLSTYDARH